ncbi:hypothetical protein TREMEDRAFT_64464 [Tremella mesenterica DSM 1558]|uniref:uncharacterized protein n=1 Tax=Tremella mesenterica (strain ATCC 24925 / CBS 8224 / DSM 1558 / NBRC 9311 / NRRL Y-6157 / RJB 2259-6 / UBC 559-6) TaxID=578456 RepID=UPI0003F49C72|nr:uncharacterized protein TREMEDRAFT_64464 [Tremella mesenterica DSM 1558]EIW67219.1 hypothetical protein TREMEDRAFT_64464 [Tremella mesenterica DSM 1558]
MTRSNRDYSTPESLIPADASTWPLASSDNNHDFTAAELQISWIHEETQIIFNPKRVTLTTKVQVCPCFRSVRTSEGYYFELSLLHAIVGNFTSEQKQLLKTYMTLDADGPLRSMMKMLRTQPETDHSGVAWFKLPLWDPARETCHSGGVRTHPECNPHALELFTLVFPKYSSS